MQYFQLKKITYVSLCEQCLFFEKCSIYCRLHLRAIIRVLCQYFAAWIENCCRCYRRPRPGILLRSFWQMGILPSHKRQPIKMFGLLMANSVWRTIVASMICQNFCWMCELFELGEIPTQVLLNPSILATRGVCNAAQLANPPVNNLKKLNPNRVRKCCCFAIISSKM